MLLVGHSLGAHIAGLVGNLLPNFNGNFKVGTIVGIDPANLRFSPLKKDRHCLTYSDAQDVIIFHATVCKMLGTGFLLGCKDYFFDGGESVVPGNPGLSHMRAVELFRELIWKEAIGWMCPRPDKTCSKLELHKIDIDLSGMMTEKKLYRNNLRLAPWPIYVETRIKYPYFGDVQPNQAPNNIPSYTIVKDMEQWREIKYQMKSDEKLELQYEAHIESE